MNNDELREKLAAIEHERWADWQKWCHEVLREQLRFNDMETNLEEILSRWEKQIATPYDELSDKEKASDMEQVDRYWPLIKQFVLEARINELKGMSVHMNPNFNQTDKIMSRIKALQDNQGASNE